MSKVHFEDISRKDLDHANAQDYIVNFEKGLNEDIIKTISNDKSEPQWIDDKHQRGILLDNVLLEFTTAPQSNKNDFIDEHKFMVNYVETTMSVYKMIPSNKSVEEFSELLLNA